MLVLLHVALATIAFFAVLDALRRPPRSWWTALVLGGAWVLLLTVVWREWGTRAGWIALGASLLYVALWLPLAGPTARALFRPEPEEWTGPTPPSPPLRHISAALAAGEVGAEEALLDLCMENEARRAAMRRHGADRTALRELYAALLRAGAGRWAGEHYIAASALAYPATLELLLASGGMAEGAVERVADFFEWGAPLPAETRTADAP